MDDKIIVHLDDDRIKAQLDDDKMRVELGDYIVLGQEKDYNNLKNKPQINGVTLQDNKSAVELRLVPIDLTEFRAVEKPTRSVRQSVELFIDNKANGAKMTLQAVKDLSTKVVRVATLDEIDYELIDENDYVVVGVDKNVSIYRVDGKDIVQEMPETTASQVTLKDEDKHFTAKNVESALLEVAQDLATKADTISLESGDIVVGKAKVADNATKALTDKNGKDITTYIAIETDPTVPEWAKAETKPTYTKEEVGLGNVDNTADEDKNVNSAKKDGKGNVIVDTYATKQDLEIAVAQSGKVDDVQAVDGTSIVENKIAKLTKKAVGLDKVDNTADSEKSVKEAGKVANKLTFKNAAKSFVEYDGAMPIGVTLKDEDFNLAQVVGDGISIGIKDKGYATKAEVETAFAGKLDKTGGTVSGDITVQGNLRVNGEVTEFKSTTLTITDKTVEVAKDNTEALTSPAGIIVNKADGVHDFGIVVDETNTFMAGKVAKDTKGNVDVNASELKPVVTREALIDEKPVKWDGINQVLVPDQRQYAQKDEDETITGAWDFSNQNGIKTNAIENRNGNRVFEYSGDRNTFGSQAKPTDMRGSEEHVRYTNNGSTYRQLAFVDEIVGTTVNTAKNVSETINNQKITDIFETDGKTVKKATSSKNADTATRANVATRADSVDVANVANRVANKVRFSGHNGNGTEQILDYDGSGYKEIAYDETDLNVSLDNGTMIVELKETGVVPGGQTTAVYSAVQVNNKGVVQAGGQSIEFGVENQTAPSQSLMVGGLFFKRK